MDEHPRGKTTSESLAKLPSVFKKDGTVTAGNASGICDGAAANVIASEEGLKRFGIKPLARIVSYGITGTSQQPRSGIALSRELTLCVATAFSRERQPANRLSWV